MKRSLSGALAAVINLAAALVTLKAFAYYLITSIPAPAPYPDTPTRGRCEQAAMRWPSRCA